MEVLVRQSRDSDLREMARIWNIVVEDGEAFPQVDTVPDGGEAGFFGGFSYCAVAESEGRVVGMYEIRPNNVGRCGHIANASYAVDPEARGMHVGRALVLDSLEQARRLGVRIMQFNAVVAENAGARHLYESLGFHRVGTIPGGFRHIDGAYHDIIVYYHEL